MSDELLEFYQAELDHFKKHADEFAQRHPKIANRLRINQEVEDPHVSRMIEAFAYLNARIRKKLDDGFPELCEAILNVLYPEYLNPIPACGIVGLNLHKSQFELTDGKVVPAGSEVNTDDVDGEPLRFRTCYPVHLLPMELERVSLQTPPFTVPPTPLAQTAKAVVRLQLETFSKDVAFGDLAIEKVRFHLNGDSRYIFNLYEHLLNDCSGIVLAASDSDKSPTQLPASALKPVGFETHESLLDYSSRSLLGYHIIKEFFAFPQKFMFLDLEGVAEHLPAKSKSGHSLVIYLFLNQISSNLETNVKDDSIAIHATPVVNLFSQRAEPIRLEPGRSSYTVTPDATRLLTKEVYSVDRVTALSPSQEEFTFLPFYSTEHGHADGEYYWYVSREADQYRVTDKEAPLNYGSRVKLHVVGLDGKKDPIDLTDWTLDVETICMNRDYPERIDRQVPFRLGSGGELINAKCLFGPTKTLRPAYSTEAYWRVLSHLSLNHTSLSDEAHGSEALQEILRLYNVSGQRAFDMMIDGIDRISSSRVVGRIGGPVSGGFCRGTQIDLHLNEEMFSGGGMFLFAAVLDRFFGLYTSLNSFTQTTVKVRQRNGDFCSWPPRSGEQVLI